MTLPDAAVEDVALGVGVKRDVQIAPEHAQRLEVAADITLRRLYSRQAR